MRDALLSRSGPDLDLVLEPGVRVGEVARFLSERFGGSYALHYAFGTGRVRLPFGLSVDLAESREEVYPYPGALPQVRPAPIAKDLERRDYTVNAMALSLAALELLDPYGGLRDLEARLLRPLHPLSFVEDPSRIVRGPAWRPGSPSASPRRPCASSLPPSCPRCCARPARAASAMSSS